MAWLKKSNKYQENKTRWHCPLLFCVYVGALETVSSNTQVDNLTFLNTFDTYFIHAKIKCCTIYWIVMIRFSKEHSSRNYLRTNTCTTALVCLQSGMVYVMLVPIIIVMPLFCNRMHLHPLLLHSKYVKLFNYQHHVR